MSQSIATNSIVKSLSDLSNAADKIIEVKPSEFVPSRISDWIADIKRTADSIVEEKEIGELDEIPGLLSVVKGKNERSSRARASAMFTEMERMHLHPRKGENVKAQKSRASLRTPLLRKTSRTKSSFGSGTPKVTPTVIKKVRNIFVAQKGDSSSGKKGKVQAGSKGESTPLDGKGTTSNIIEIEAPGSSKRKSTEIMPESNKNAKIDINQVEKEKVIKNPRVEVEKLMKAKDLSVSKKESRALRSKMETKQESAAENRKNLMSLHQQKLDQNKKIREAKLAKLRLGGKEPIQVEKTVTKSGTPREASDSVLKNQNKDKKTPLSHTQKKLLDEAKKTKTLGTSVSSELKNKKQETKKMLNSTYITNDDQPSTSSKGKVLKKAHPTSEAMKDISNDKKTKDNKNAATQIVKPLKVTSESYAMTPAHSSFISYDISEIRSDSEDEETGTSSKPIPSWATGVRLRNALLQQHHHPIDSDELFGNIFPAPNLVAIMGVNKKQYHKRTSSAVWSSFS